MLGAPIVANPTLPGPMVAAYSRRRGVIFVRPNQPHAVERCAVAHELVHWEYKDVGTTNARSEEHTSETPVTNAQLVCRLLLVKINTTDTDLTNIYCIKT